MKSKITYILILIVLLLGSAINLYYTRISLPTYKYDGVNLTIGNQTYVYEASNISLRPIEIGRAIGIGVEEKGDIRNFIFPYWINEIKGQNDRKWVQISGLMWDGIYKRKDIHTFNIKNIKINNIQQYKLDEKQTFIRKSYNTKLINSIKESLNSKGRKIVSDINPKYELRVFSTEFKGLYYNIDVILENKKVYLSDKGKLYMVDKELSRWISQD